MGAAFWSNPFGLVLACLGGGQPPFGRLSFVCPLHAFALMLAQAGWDGLSHGRGGGHPAIILQYCCRD
jgi:hypothetical protein